MNIDDSGSDSSDEDFNPETQKAEVVSEEDSDGCVEEDGDEEEDGKRKRGKKGKRRAKTKKQKVEEPDEDDVEEVVAPIKPEEQKKKADSLWADFLKDTDFKPKPKTSADSTPNELQRKIEKKVTVTKIFEFAGEEVKVTKEVPVDSLEARISTTSTAIAPSRGRSRGGLGGISSVLNQLGKKQKISTLEKTKLDWDRFKKDEKIEEELTSHNKGKNGYLERQDFLQRADLRQFEIEKQIRATHRSSRI